MLQSVNAADVPPPRPRVLQWTRYAEGLLVETDRAQFMIAPDDEDGVNRLLAMIRTEFGAGVAGNC